MKSVLYAVLVMLSFVASSASAKVHTKTVFDLRRVYDDLDPRYCAPESNLDESPESFGYEPSCGKTAENPCVIHEYEPGYEPYPAVQDSLCFKNSQSLRRKIVEEFSMSEAICRSAAAAAG